MSATNRRYDIDWIRVIAIGLLLIYHVAIGFQSWGLMIGFITNEQSWGSLWIPMTMLNVWRIPLLFFVSGMGVYFAMQNKTWLQLLKDRTARIWVPFLFGAFVIVPIHIYLTQVYYKMQPDYIPNPGHLWFLGNIFAYFLLLSPLFYYLKKNEDGKFVQGLKKLFRTPLGLIPVIAVFVAEAMIIKPYPYEMYSMTWHGFFLGFFAFLFGFLFVLSGSSFWEMISRWKWMFLGIAIVLFITRTIHFQMNTPIYLLVTESDCWIISVFAFGYRYLNHSGHVLSYLSQAAYPVYILHMVFLYLGSIIIFPLQINVQLQFVLVLLFTLGGSLITYEFLIRRVKFIRPLFGLKLK